MESIVEQLQLKDIDKSSWQKYRFDQIAKNISERVEPTTTDLEVYVGLEHIDSDSIHIKRYGNREDVNGTKLRCYPGDVIFGRRRAYQRKAAIVEFDGFCSAHSLVLRANPDVISPKLFPFFLHSDTFMHRAIDISVGSLSPTINWGDLKKQEFLLPPKGQQEQIAELLWAGDEMIQKSEVLQNTLKNSYQIVLENIFDLKSHNWDILKLSKVADVNAESLRSSSDPNLTFKYLDIAGIIEPKVIGELQQYTFSTAPGRARRKLKKGSIVLSLVRPYHKAFVIVNDATGIIASTGTGVVDTKENILNRFLFHQFFTKRFEEYCEVKMSGTNYPAITPIDLKDFEVFVPKNFEEQSIVAAKLDAIDLSIMEAKRNILSSKVLHKSLISEIF